MFAYNLHTNERPTINGWASPLFDTTPFDSQYGVDEERPWELSSLIEGALYPTRFLYREGGPTFAVVFVAVERGRLI